MSKKGIFFGFLGVVGCIGTSIWTGITTFKNHDKIQKCLDENKGVIETVKEVGKEYLPVAGAIAGTAGTIIASEVIGDKKTNELKTALSTATKNFKHSRQMLHNQTSAIKTFCDADEQAKIEQSTQILDKIDAVSEGVLQDVETFYDHATGISFQRKRADVEYAIMERNRELACYDSASFAAFYDQLDIDLKKACPEAAERGWSRDVANAMWVDPWIILQIREERVPGIGKAQCIYYAASATNATEKDYPLMDFSPVDDYIEDEEGNCPWR